MVVPRQHKPLILKHMVGPKKQPYPQGENVLSCLKEQSFALKRKGAMLIQGIIMFLWEAHVSEILYNCN
jgi:hypothetical protein